MHTLNARITDLSFHLQSLTTSEHFPKVKEAVERKDRSSLAKICEKAKIPRNYTDVVINVLLSVGPDQKWPATL